MAESIARPIYEDVASQEMTAEEMARELARRAEEMRRLNQQDQIDEEQQAVIATIRDGVVQTLESDGVSPEEVTEEDIAQAADQLEQASQDVEETMGGMGTTVKQLDEGVAGQAPLGGSEIFVDPNAIQGGEDGRIVNRQWAQDVADHEKRHNDQSAEVDADEVVTTGGLKLNVTELREWDAMHTQSSVKNNSADYQQIFATGERMFADTERARELIKQGRIAELQEEVAGSVSPLVDPEKQVA